MKDYDNKTRLKKIHRDCWKISGLSLIINLWRIYIIIMSWIYGILFILMRSRANVNL